MIILGLLLLFTLIRNKKPKNVKQKTYGYEAKISLKEYMWFILLFAVILSTPKFYSSLELLLLGIILIPLSAFVFWEVFRPIAALKWRVATASIFVLAFFSMSQNTPGVNTENEKSKYNILSFGTYYGENKMDSYDTFRTGGNSCDGGTTGPLTSTSVEDNFRNNYFLLGAGYQYVSEKSKDKKFTFQSNLSFSRIVEDQNIKINQTASYPLSNGTDSIVTNFYQSSNQNITNNFTVNPFVKFDYKGIGFGVGLMLGNFSLFHVNPEERSNANSPIGTLNNYFILPQFHFRLGHLGTVWGEFNYAYRFPGISPASEMEFLLGINFNKGNFLKIGSSSFHYLVIRPQISLNKNLAIEPYFGLGGSLFKSDYLNQSGFEGGINLHYRFKDANSKTPLN